MALRKVWRATRRTEFSLISIAPATKGIRRERFCAMRERNQRGARGSRVARSSPKFRSSRVGANRKRSMVNPRLTR